MINEEVLQSILFLNLTVSSIYIKELNFSSNFTISVIQLHKLIYYNEFEFELYPSILLIISHFNSFLIIISIRSVGMGQWLNETGNIMQ